VNLLHESEKEPEEGSLEGKKARGLGEAFDTSRQGLPLCR